MAFRSSCSRKLLPLLTLTLCTPLLFPQSGSERVTVGQPQKVAGKRNGAVKTTIPVTILPGFHVNSNTPADEYLKPLSVTWTSLGALEGGQITYPKAEKIKVGDQELSVFTGKIDLAAVFRISAKAPAGSGAASGELHYQACDHNRCFPPKTVGITVPYQIR